MAWYPQEEAEAMALVTRAGRTADRVAVQGWQVASSDDTGDDAGSAVSLPGYDARWWLDAPPRSTVMAGLLANGEYPDIFRSTAMRDQVDPARFAVPWWYRTLFTAPTGRHVHLRLDGVIPRADLWVNGRCVADATRIAGAYTVTTVDVTDVVHPGLNALALLVHPGNPMQDLSIGWVDWSQLPPDDNMGPWRDVTIGCTGPIRLGAPHVVTTLLDASGRAGLRVSVDADNLSDRPETVVLAGIVTGHGEQLPFHHRVTLEAGESRTVRLDDEPLTLDQPRLWWPVGEGDQPLYRVAVTATVDGVLSDHTETPFGVRTVDSEVMPGGGRRFRINGRPVQILGAGWSPDLFLRTDPHRLEAQLALTAHLGLNTIRPEGKLENPEFYDRCDQLGLMVLPGWECCNKWEAAAGTGGELWDDTDIDVAERSMAAEAVLLRNHPCVIGFLIGSDFAPPTEVAARYAAALADAGWDLPVIASATTEGSDVSGPSGMKMTGPYDWVPPGYWYDRDPALGGAVGFNSETSAGHTVPRLPSLRRMLSPSELDQLWQQPQLRQYHSGPPSVFDNLAIFGRALAERYGPAASLEDFVKKAQLAAYEATRAQFEAFTLRATAEEPATGVIYWMLSAPWPSLNWQLFDYELDTPGSYNGARKALEALRALYAYDDHAVRVLNRTGAATGPVQVTVRTWRADGTPGTSEQTRVGSLAAGEVAEVGAVSAPSGVQGAWWLELEMTEGAGAPADPAAAGPAERGRTTRNVYWLSTVDDELDRSTTTWHSTGVSRFADLRALDELRAARVRATAEATIDASELAVAVTLDHDDPSGTPAVGLHASVTVDGVPLAPVLWDDNDVTLFTGQSVTLRGRLTAPSRLGAGRLRLQVDGFNLHRSLVLPLAGVTG